MKSSLIASTLFALTIFTVPALALVPAEARAEEPTAADFRISYFRRLDEYSRSKDKWDENNRVFMTANDLQRHVNRARCVCNDEIRIGIQREGSERTIDAGRLEVYVGEACNQSLPQNVGQIYGDCTTRHDYQTDAASEWLQSVPQQDFEVSTFANPTPPAVDESWIRPGVAPACNGNQSSGGVWVCFGTQNCIGREFFIQGDHSANAQQSSGGEDKDEDEGASQSGGGINFDFRGPLSPPVDIKVNPGDSSITLNWELQTSADIAGYRVLCADSGGRSLGMSEEFIDGDAPPAAYKNEANIYHTAQMFCGKTFVEFDDAETSSTDTGVVETTSPTSDPTTATTSDGLTMGEGDLETSSGLLARGGEQDQTGDPTDEASDPTDPTDPTGAAEGEAGDTDVENEEERDENPWAYESKSGIEGLNWAYICSEHIERRATTARIEGLDNDQNYRFVLVAYDRAGNPTPSFILEGRPERTKGVEGVCEDPEFLCGEAGFCNMSPSRRGVPLGWSLILVGLFAGGALRRTRRFSR